MSVKIYSYQKVQDSFTTYTLQEPDYQENDPRIIELCTIDGITYISIPATITLPEQSVKVVATLQEVNLTDDLKKQIKTASPHIRLIRKRVREKIEKKISQSDELKLYRLAINKLLIKAGIRDNLDFTDFVSHYDYTEICRTWGQVEKVKLGL